MVNITDKRGLEHNCSYDQRVVGSTTGQVAMKWLLLGRATVCAQT